MTKRSSKCRNPHTEPISVNCVKIQTIRKSDVSRIVEKSVNKNAQKREKMAKHSYDGVGGL